jgi:hypothetical protein
MPVRRKCPPEADLRLLLLISSLFSPHELETACVRNVAGGQEALNPAKNVPECGRYRVLRGNRLREKGIFGPHRAKLRILLYSSRSVNDIQVSGAKVSRELEQGTQELPK